MINSSAVLKRGAALLVTAAVVFAASSVIASPASAAGFCAQVLSPGSYCDSPARTDLGTANGSATAGGEVSIKLFDINGTGIGMYLTGTGSASVCVSTLFYGWARIRNSGAAAHTYNGNTYGYPC